MALMNEQKTVRRTKLWGLPLASGVLLTLSFPPAHFSFLAWIALVPLFVFLGQSRSARESSLAVFFTGLVFFAFSLSWLCYVSLFGWVFVTFLLAGFLTLFGVLHFYVSRLRFALLHPLTGSLAWMAVEIIRTEFPIFGLGWNLIGYSQASHPAVIQSASLFGVYGLGFLIVFVNASAAEILSSCRGGEKGTPPAYARAAVLAVFLAAAAAGNFAWGLENFKAHAPAQGTASVRIGVIQGNIPQSLKWEAEVKDSIIDIHVKLLELISYQNPALILWPEASFPGYFNADPDAATVMEWIKHWKIPVIIGAPYYAPDGGAYNSAFYISPEGEIKGRYDKIYLVPFGEYVPLGPILGWLQPAAQALGVSDFLAGKTLTSFRLDKDNLTFSVLICFEDVFPRLVKDFVTPEHQFLAVITNDAWFGPTGAPFQHLQASILRAVENGIPVVRSANTGVSAFISSRGEVLGAVEDEKGRKIFVPGFKTLDLPLARHETFYHRGGWAVPYGVSILLVLGAVIRAWAGRSRAREADKEAADD